MVSNHFKDLFELVLLEEAHQRSETMLPRSVMGFRKGCQPSDVLFTLHRVAVAAVAAPERDAERGEPSGVVGCRGRRSHEQRGS